MKTQFKTLVLPAGGATDTLLEKMVGEGWTLVPEATVLAEDVKFAFSEQRTPGPRFLFLLQKKLTS